MAQYTNQMKRIGGAASQAARMSALDQMARMPAASMVPRQRRKRAASLPPVVGRLIMGNTMSPPPTRPMPRSYMNRFGGMA